MVQINFAQKTVTAKIVYYGPGMSGKTTNLEVIHQRAPDNNRGDLTSISTDGDRTLFFDFMPLDLGTVAGMRTSFQIYTVPGQVYYNSTRKLVLQGVDGVVFVADSSASMTQENLESFKNLEENLAEYGKSLANLPHIIQWNKRDLPDALPVEQLEELVNKFGVTTFEGVANTGQGVFPTLKALAARVLESIHSSHLGGSSAPAPVAATAQQAAPAMAAPPQPMAAPAAAFPTPAPMAAAPVPAAPAHAAPPAGVPAGMQQAMPGQHAPMPGAAAPGMGAPGAGAPGMGYAPPPAQPQVHEGLPLQMAAAPPPAPTGGAYGQPPAGVAPMMQPATPGVAQTRQRARPATATPAQPGLEGTRFRPRSPSPQPARPTPKRKKKSGGGWLYTAIFVVLAVAVGGVVTRIVLSYFT